jgi:hypothetical protein
MVNTNHISYILINIFSCVGITVDVVWIDEWIYWSLTLRPHDRKLYVQTLWRPLSRMQRTYFVRSQPFIYLFIFLLAIRNLHFFELICWLWSPLLLLMAWHEALPQWKAPLFSLIYIWLCDDDDDGEVCEMNGFGRGNRSTRRKPAPTPLFPPQIPLARPADEPGPPRWEASDYRFSYGAVWPQPKHGFCGRIVDQLIGDA